MYDNIIIDGKNIIYRAAAAARSSSNNVHPTTIFIRMMDKWKRAFKPKKWHVFWDVPKNNLWRKKVYPEYKDGRSYDEKYVKLVKKSQETTALVLNNMKITQYIKSGNEADDLIYAFVLSKIDEDNIIISSDGDIIQIPYHIKSSKKLDLYNPGNKKIDLVKMPKYDPVIVKCLSGDKADNIKNYRLVKEKTAAKIIDKGLDEYLDKKGSKLFKLNKILIDLSKNPYLKKNIKYIDSVKENDKFDISAIKGLIPKYSITGLSAELSSKVMPFKNI
jgi:5'-3' exonuclease